MCTLVYALGNERENVKFYCKQAAAGRAPDSRNRFHLLNP